MTLLKVYLSFTALIAAAIFLSNPDYYLWAWASPAFLGAALIALSDTGSKKLLLLSYLAVGVYAFVIGRFFVNNGLLTSDGRLLMLAVFPLMLFVAIRVYVVETGEA